MLRLYDYLDSGNGYKARLLLHLLGEPFELIELDIMEGHLKAHDAFVGVPDHRRHRALRLHPRGRRRRLRYVRLSRDPGLVRARGGPTGLRRDYGGVRSLSLLCCHHRARPGDPRINAPRRPGLPDQVRQ